MVLLNTGSGSCLYFKICCERTNESEQTRSNKRERTENRPSYLEGSRLTPEPKMIFRERYKKTSCIIWKRMIEMAMTKQKVYLAMDIVGAVHILVYYLFFESSSSKLAGQLFGTPRQALRYRFLVFTNHLVFVS